MSPGVGVSARALTAFMAERCPWPVLLAVAGALVLGPGLASGRQGPAALAAATASVALGLLLLRIADDLADLERDRRLAPRRGLPSGRIDPAALGRTLLPGLVLMVLLNPGPGLWAVLAGLGWYAAYYRFRRWLPATLRPWLVNAVFPLAVLYGAGGASVASLWLAAFVGFAVVGHDYAHEVRAPGEEGHRQDSASARWGAGRAALAGILLYLAASAAGAGAWIALERPPLFGVALLAVTGGLAPRLWALWRRPAAGSARRLYVAGFVYFLLPLAVLPLEPLVAAPGAAP